MRAPTIGHAFNNKYNVLLMPYSIHCISSIDLSFTNYKIQIYD